MKKTITKRNDLSYIFGYTCLFLSNFLPLIIVNSALRHFTGNWLFLKSESIAIEFSLAAIVVGICILLAELFKRFRADRRMPNRTNLAVFRLIVVLAIIEMTKWVTVSIAFGHPLENFFVQPIGQMMISFSFVSSVPSALVGTCLFESRFLGITFGILTSFQVLLPFLFLLARASS